MFARDGVGFMPALYLSFLDVLRQLMALLRFIAADGSRKKNCLS
jgi:hypothetical protein